MTKADIVEQVSEATGLTKVETEAVLDGIIFYIIDSLKRGERVDMRGFGSFLVKQRPAREARNPATSEIVKLNERFDPIFKVSKLLRKSVNQSLLRGFWYKGNNLCHVVKKEKKEKWIHIKEKKDYVQTGIRKRINNKVT